MKNIEDIIKEVSDKVRENLGTKLKSGDTTTSEPVSEMAVGLTIRCIIKNGGGQEEFTAYSMADAQQKMRSYINNPKYKEVQLLDSWGIVKKRLVN